MFIRKIFFVSLFMLAGAIAPVRAMQQKKTSSQSLAIWQPSLIVNLLQNQRQENDPCVICRRNSKINAYKLPQCIHSYCRECIKTWLRDRILNGAALSCPLCNRTCIPSDVKDLVSVPLFEKIYHRLGAYLEWISDEAEVNGYSAIGGLGLLVSIISLVGSVTTGSPFFTESLLPLLFCTVTLLGYDYVRNRNQHDLLNDGLIGKLLFFETAALLTSVLFAKLRG